MPESTALPIAPPPGVVTTETDLVSAGRWVASNKVRFVGGKPEKIGGWTKAYATPTDGTPRSTHAWRQAASQLVAAGTYKKLYVYDTDLAQNDITPYRLAGTYANNPFATTDTSAIVSVTHASHGQNPGNIFTTAGSAAVGGITPNGTYTVLDVTDVDHFRFTHTAPATSTVAAGGGASVTYSYEIPLGSELGTYGLGWGVGLWGIGTWGDPHSASTIFVEPRVWSLANFGTILIATYNGGAIYTFDPSAAQPWGRASVIAAAPTDCRAAFVTEERFVVALRDNMRVDWCSQGDYTVWTPSATNTANTRTLQQGTRLVSGRVLGPFQSMIWSDAAAFIMQWTGNKYVHDTRMVGKDCGLLAPGAAVTVGGVAYWMGGDTFWMYDGSVRQMPAVDDIRSTVYDELSVTLTYQATAIYSPKFQEIWFFYTPTGETNPTKYVIYSIPNQCWAPGTLGRASGTHFTQNDTRPIMAGTDGYLYRHEDGLNGDGSVIEWNARLAAFALDKGNRNMEVDGFEPDFTGQVGNVSAVLSFYDRLRDSAALETETLTIASTDVLVDCRSSGRYLGIALSGSALGGDFRLGQPQLFVKPSGIRR